MTNEKTFSTVDPTALAKHFESAEAEKRWDAVWQETGIYHWDPSKSRAETFVVDTPPPTVSGSLHIGHVFSYAHADVVTRYKRMRGFNIFYPMGWDDNGLPTERRVQNYFHVRCEPSAPRIENVLSLEEATDSQHKEPPRLLSRPDFIELCHKLTEKDEQAYRNLFTRLALSVDWRQTYATIDDRCRKLAQLSFLDLKAKGHAYLTFAPTMWDVDFQTAVAQAEVQDRPKQGAFHHIEFGVEGGTESFVIATTRPELLPACVGVTAHPSDARYKHLFGKNAVTPLFKAPVPIFPSELADPEKGSGILMVCTFGDQTDVHWWRTEKLKLRQIIGKQGRLEPVTFGDDDYPSLDPAAANAWYAQLVGKAVNQARSKIVELLCYATGSSVGPNQTVVGAGGIPSSEALGNAQVKGGTPQPEDGAPLTKAPEPVQQAVKFFEKGDRPLEFLSTRQWFVRLTDKKEALLEKGQEIHWHPEFMQARYRDWTSNLGIDWCVSRQRYFGVPIPVWFGVKADGTTDFEKVILPKESQLPVDPMSDVPEGYSEAQRNQPGGFVGEADIFDTWFTSSLTPEIGSHWLLDEERHAKLFPADIRPQSHEIIRTWAFYTIAKAMLHENQVPWHDVVISGWILDPNRKGKISKTTGGSAVTPHGLFDEHGVDAVRYWAASARLGADTAFDDKVFKIGRRLVTKLFNASKFVLGHSGEVRPITHELDRAFIEKLRLLVKRVTESQEEYNFAQALQDTESFFWTHFTDTYLELAKPRAWTVEGVPVDADARGSAIAALRLGLSVLLRLFAPVLPYITEEVWSWVFATETGHKSVHKAPWPTLEELSHVAAPADAGSFDLAVDAFAAINKAKADGKVSAGRVVEKLTVVANEKTLGRVQAVLGCALDAARCQSHAVETAELEDGVFEVRGAVFAEKA